MKTNSLTALLYPLFACAFFCSGAEPEKAPNSASAAPESLIEFVAHDADYESGKRKRDTFQINIRDTKQPSLFLSIGENFRVGDVTFTIVRFEPKKRPHPILGAEDVSELTVVNVATKKPTVLTKRKVEVAVGEPRPKK